MILLSVLTFVAYMLVLLTRELHHLQLNSYRNERYRRWWPGPGGVALLAAISVVLLVAAVLSFLGFGWPVDLLWLGACLGGGWILLRQKKKKPLVYTQRALRLLAAVVLLTLLIGVVVMKITSSDTYRLGLWALSLFVPLYLLLANIITRPVERRINDWYIQDARRIVQAMPGLQIIAITGSYGKTSVKHFLTAILAEHYAVLMTPGSYNTTMGVVRTIREMLKPTHEVFVVEMGAKQIGDIEEICSITPPQRAILTAVGPQHLETFGSIENVQRTKFEIVEALPPGGTAFLNADYDLIFDREIDPDLERIFYSVETDRGVYQAKNIRYIQGRMHFTVVRSGEEIMQLETQLLGQHNASNLLVSCAVALDMGVAPRQIAYAVRQLAPVEHRLQLRHFPGGYTVLDDAFNSNPIGARQALEVLSQLGADRCIIITPGMIELGEQQYDLNYRFGEQIAAVCDYVILVGPKQTQPIQEALQAAGYPAEKSYVARNLADANAHLRPLLRSGDVVLYENDLPDTFNE